MHFLHNNFLAIMIIFFLALLVSLIFLKKYMHTRHIDVPYSIKTAADIPKLFPKSSQEIENRVDASIAHAQKLVDTIIEIPQEHRTFDNTVQALDFVEHMSPLAITANIVSVLKYVSPDDAIRTACQQSILKISRFALEHISNNKALYNALKQYTETNQAKETLTNEEQYYIKKTVEDFKRRGLELPDEKIKKVRELENEITELSLQFDTHIASDNRSIHITLQELEGLDAEYIATLKRTSDGLYTLGIDCPTYMTVMKHCRNSNTRKALYKTFTNRAFPTNELVLQKIIDKRTELAHLLGFDTYADLNLDTTMIKKKEEAEKFLRSLLEKAAPKEATDFKKLVSELPPSVQLSDTGKLHPWDIAFVKSEYEKKHFDLDDRLIAQYLSLIHI